MHNLGKHVCKQSGLGNYHRGNAFLDIRVQYFLQFYFQRYECDPSMLDFHLFKLLKIYWRFTLNSKPICVQIRKPQRNIIFFGDLWKKENLVFLTFKDNLLALNSLLTFVSSLFIFFKQDVNVTVWKKRFVSSANMIWFSTFEAWCKSFTYNRNNKSLGASYRILGAGLVVKVSRCQIILDILHFAQFPILIFKFNFAISSFGNF